jgi:hypothetical protein
LFTDKYEEWNTLSDIVPPTKAEADKMLRESGISEGAIKEALDRMKKKKGSAVK